MKYRLQVVTTLRDESVTVHFDYYPGSSATREHPGDEPTVDLTAVVRDDGTRLLHLCSQADCKALEEVCYEEAPGLMGEMHDASEEHEHLEELNRGYYHDRL